MKIEGVKCNQCGRIIPENDRPPGWISFLECTTIIMWGNEPKDNNKTYDIPKKYEIPEDTDFCSIECLVTSIKEKFISEMN